MLVFVYVYLAKEIFSIETDSSFVHKAGILYNEYLENNFISIIIIINYYYLISRLYCNECFSGVQFQNNKLNY